MRNITLLGTALAALTATMLLASPASAYRDKDYYGDHGPGSHRADMYMYGGRNRDHYRDRDHYGDRSHRGDMYMYGGRNRDHYRDSHYYGDRRSGMHLHVPGIGGIQLGH
jgi:hypothetical protein